MRKLITPTRGQSLVEFALALPLLAIMLIGLAEFGFLLYAHVQVANAAREGARAGSLFLGGRFHYTACTSSCPTGFGNGGDCWDLKPWVENAIAEYNRNGNGCPGSSFSTVVHSLGGLNPAQCTTAAQTDCWVINTLTVNGESSRPPGGTTEGKWVSDHVGQPLRLELQYRYNMPFTGSFLRVVENPVRINKTVIMMVQNN